MESAVRYDFSFPPKSSNSHLLQSAASCNMNGHVVHQQPIHGMRSGHSGSHHMHSDKFNYNSTAGNNNNSGVVGLPKSASTSLLSCASSTNNINGSSHKLNNNNNNYCGNCTTTPADILNNNSMLQNNLNMKQQCHVTTKHHTVIKPSSLLLNQNQQMHHGAIANSISHSIANGPQTPKDSNCSFSNILFTWENQIEMEMYRTFFKST